MPDEKRGLRSGIAAYTAWGIFPLYWKMLAAVPVWQVIGHRILWSTVLLTIWIAASGRSSELRQAIADRRVLGAYAVAALLIAVNWSGFVWAVGAGFIVETSLGYFINPLLSVLLGVFVLGEKLRRLQWLAVAIAAAGVAYLAFAYGRLPWISLVLATSFALYGLVKKQAPLGPVQGLTLETGLLALPALAVLVGSELHGDGAFLHASPLVTALLFGAGAVTTIPLLMFATAAQSIPLLWIGLLQYIAPTLQLAIGVLVYGEPFSGDRVIGFALVWAALAVFAVEGVLQSRVGRMQSRADIVVPPPE
jgi:chloramphenicol-sensitive protein RarD